MIGRARRNDNFEIVRYSCNNSILIHLVGKIGLSSYSQGVPCYKIILNILSYTTSLIDEIG